MHAAVGAQAARNTELQWLCRQLDKLTTKVSIFLPSEWSERKRYLPASTSALAGYYRFSVTPYHREIIDCMSPESPVRSVALRKGVQVGATTLIESTIGYYIDQVKTAPMMLVTADAEMARLRMDAYVVPMLKHSNLDHLVRSLDEVNKQKKGRTRERYEWEGGGFLLPLGAVNCTKLRSVSIAVLLRDEIDSWDDSPREGDPMQLSMDRTAAFESSRKIMSVSTPLLKGSSRIDRLFEQGDQRFYHVKCLDCGHPQELRWNRIDTDTGRVSGIVWETDDEGRLVAGSVRYACEQCGHLHTNEDKTKLFADGNAEWVPTAVPQIPNHRSYHLSQLYSPVGMASWTACVEAWLNAWDPVANKARDLASLQVFYNNVLGKSFRVHGEQLRFEAVSSLRTHEYLYGQIANKFASAYCGSPILILTAAVDVHAHNLGVAVFGWCRGRRAFLIDYWRFQGPTQNTDEPKTWGQLRKVIEETEYVADDGQRYKVEMTVVDSGFQTDVVHRFCDEYTQCVHPVRGRSSPPQGTSLKEFWPYATGAKLQGYAIGVDIFKERWAAALKRSWDGLSMQPEGFFNAPQDCTDAQIKELTIETWKQRVDKATGKKTGFAWVRPGGADNTLWDLLIYNSAALEICAAIVCIQSMGRESTDWDVFWRSLE